MEQYEDLTEGKEPEILKNEEGTFKKAGMLRRPTLVVSDDNDKKDK